MSNFEKFENWISERESQNDWQNYLWGGGLNISEISREVGCNPRALTGQNKKINERMNDLIKDLTKRGVLDKSRKPNKDNTLSGAVRDKQIARLRAENNSLKETNAQLRAKIMEYEAQAEVLGVLGKILEETGRTPYDAD